MSGFAWTKFYTEFATSLLSYADDRASLIEKVKQIYINAKMKLPTLKKEITSWILIRSLSSGCLTRV